MPPDSLYSMELHRFGIFPNRISDPAGDDELADALALTVIALDTWGGFLLYSAPTDIANFYVIGL